MKDTVIGLLGGAAIMAVLGGTMAYVSWPEAPHQQLVVDECCAEAQGQLAEMQSLHAEDVAAIAEFNRRYEWLERRFNELERKPTYREWSNSHGSRKMEAK